MGYTRGSGVKCGGRVDRIRPCGYMAVTFMSVVMPGKALKAGGSRVLFTLNAVRRQCQLVFPCHTVGPYGGHRIRALHDAVALGNDLPVTQGNAVGLCGTISAMGRARHSLRYRDSSLDHGGYARMVKHALCSTQSTSTDFNPSGGRRFGSRRRGEW
ncbi:hypothetical protein DPEC_G00024330 [Dallia pectoralis]|uniref:Uncharacterized protein n=1 Tax=Dallia pectoralis TaxID=75939 RepID=A0ACC2HI09_DALPE|nr:hypothetical protein DPEC_G00024330 [Dallia pectoralis]